MHQKSALSLGKRKSPAWAKIMLIAVLCISFTQIAFADDSALGFLGDTVMELIVGAFTVLLELIAIIVAFILDVIMGAFEVLFEPQFLQTVYNAIPALTLFDKIITVSGITIAVAITGVALIHTMLIPLITSGQKSGYPSGIALRCFMSIVAVVVARNFAVLMTNFLGVFYTAFHQTAADGGAFGSFSILGTITSDAVTSLFSGNALPRYENIGGIGAGILDAIVVPIQFLITFLMMLLVGWNLIHFYLELFERYAAMFFLIKITPLAFATIASPNTDKVAKSWCSFFAGQGALWVLQSFSLALIQSDLAHLDNFTAAFGQSIGGTSGSTMVGFFVWAGTAYGLISLARHMDNYINKLGLTAAVTGDGFFRDLASLTSFAKNMTPKAIVNTGKGVGEMLGAAYKAPINAAGTVAKGISNMAGRVVETSGHIGESVKQAGVGAKDSVINDVKDAVNTNVVQSFKQGKNAAKLNHTPGENAMDDRFGKDKQSEQNKERDTDEKDTPNLSDLNGKDDTNIPVPFTTADELNNEAKLAEAESAESAGESTVVDDNSVGRVSESNELQQAGTNSETVPYTEDMDSPPPPTDVDYPSNDNYEMEASAASPEVPIEDSYDEPMSDVPMSDEPMRYENQAASSISTPTSTGEEFSEAVSMNSPEEPNASASMQDDNRTHSSMDTEKETYGEHTPQNLSATDLSSEQTSIQAGQSLPTSKDTPAIDSETMKHSQGASSTVADSPHQDNVPGQMKSPQSAAVSFDSEPHADAAPSKIVNNRQGEQTASAGHQNPSTPSQPIQGTSRAIQSENNQNSNREPVTSITQPSMSQESHVPDAPTTQMRFVRTKNASTSENQTVRMEHFHNAATTSHETINKVNPQKDDSLRKRKPTKANREAKEPDFKRDRESDGDFSEKQGKS